MTELNLMGITYVLFYITSREILRNLVPKPLEEYIENVETSNNSRRQEEELSISCEVISKWIKILVHPSSFLYGDVITPF